MLQKLNTLCKNNNVINGLENVFNAFNDHFMNISKLTGYDNKITQYQNDIIIETWFSDNNMAKSNGSSNKLNNSRKLTLKVHIQIIENTPYQRRF